MQSHKPGYAAALAACKHFGKKWDELTEQERKWTKEEKSSQGRGTRVEKRKPSGKPAVVKIPKENRDDLFFLADAPKMVADEMRALNASLRELIAEAGKETSG